MHKRGAMNPDVATRITLPRAPRACIEELSRRRHPREACGLLIGRRTGSRVEIVEVREARNRAESRAHDRYELDPVDHLAAEEHAASLGLKVVGVWHSHPDRPALPSETDRRGAHANWSYVIVAVTSDVVTELRSWRLVDGAFEEEIVE